MLVGTDNTTPTSTETVGVNPESERTTRTPASGNVHSKVLRLRGRAGIVHPKVLRLPWWAGIVHPKKLRLRWRAGHVVMKC